MGPLETLLLPLNTHCCLRLYIFYYCSVFLGAQNKCTKFLLCCLKCCFWCLEKFVKFLNRNAYIMVRLTEQHSIGNISDLDFRGLLSHNSVLQYLWFPYENRWCSTLFIYLLIILIVWSYQVAIYGKNFCTSARDAFFLLMRNIIR